MNDMEHKKQSIAKQMLWMIILCGFLSVALPAAEPVPFADLTPAQAAALIKEKSADPLFVILDVRTAKEFAMGRIKGARNIDVKAANARERLGKLDRNGSYLLYCRGGMRSARAMGFMKGKGFKKVYNLAGGLMRWQAEKLPLETSPGL